MFRQKKIFKYVNSDLDFFFLEKDLKKNKINRVYYLTLLLITYLKKIKYLLKLKRISNIYLKSFFNINLNYSRRKLFAFKYRLKYLKKKKKYKIPYRIFFSIYKKNKFKNFNLFLFLKVSILLKLRFFFLFLNKDIKKNFFLFKFFILLNINKLSSFIRIKRFKVFLLLLHFFFKIRKKG
jgi:hypothetical protein